MSSSPPFRLEFQARPSSPLAKCLRDLPLLLPGSPTSSGKRLSPVLTPTPPQAHGNGYSDRLPHTLASPPTVNFYDGCLKPPDCREPKPQLDLPLGKKYCGVSLSSQAGTSASLSPPKAGSCHYSDLSTPGSPICAIRIPPGSSSSPCSLQSQAPRNPCFESLLSWETGGNSYLLLTPGTSISGPAYPQECPLSLPFHSPYPVHPCPSTPDNHHSTGPLQCHNQPLVPPSGTSGTPREPLLPPQQPVVSPCTTHIYSFVPSRMPLNPQSLPIAPHLLSAIS
ncbi:sperm head and tail associated protein-like [Rhynchocyon petersi]